MSKLMKARILYAQTYMMNCRVAVDAATTAELAYAEVKAQYGTAVLTQLREFHQANQAA